METYKFVGDLEEIKKFYIYTVPKIERDQILYFSLSARNKCLTDEERKYYQLGRSEMIEKTIIRHNSFEHFLSKIYSKEMNINGMLTKAMIPYPQKSLRLYWNINPSSVTKVLFEQQKMINEMNIELVSSALKGSKDGVEESFYKMRKVFDKTLSLYSRCITERTWIDFECDIDSSNNIEKFEKHIHNYFSLIFPLGSFLIIKTPGGYHFMIKLEQIQKRGSIIKNDPNKSIINDIKIQLNNEGIIYDEVIRNDNEMIILPGTYCYDKNGKEMICKVLNWDDFSEKDIIIKE